MRAQIKEIIDPFHGKRNVSKKRIQALEAAGYEVSYYKVGWNWGRSGSVDEKDGYCIVQMGCSYLTRARRGRLTLNKCHLFKVTKK